MGTLVLLRHGESEWNSKGLFTGWVDIGLSEKGAEEAANGGRLFAEAGLHPDVVHTSVLTRAIQTANITLAVADLLWLPVRRSWRLNERHYGALQGKDKAQTRKEFGDEQFMLWRRSYDVPPPPIADADPLSHGLSARATIATPALVLTTVGTTSSSDSRAQSAMSAVRPAALSAAASSLAASASSGVGKARATASATSAASVRGPHRRAIRRPATYTSSSATAPSVPEQTICISATRRSSR